MHGSEQFSASQMMKDVIAADMDVSILDGLDERDITRSPNVYEWVTNRRFLNVDPFPRQVEILLKLFEEVCPSKHCTDVDYWFHNVDSADNPIQVDTRIDDMLERVTLFNHGVCPKCGRSDRFYSRGKNPRRIRSYEEINGLAGMRSSKTVLVGRFIATYQLHRYLTIPNPSKFYGLLPDTNVFISFTASSKKQALDTLWDHFYSAYQGCKWFQEYNSFLDVAGEKLGREMYQVAQEFIKYNHKRIVARAEAPNVRTIRGLTRFLAAIDEIGWMSTLEAEGKTKVIGDADGIHTALEKSLRTIRSAAENLRRRGVSNVPTALMCNVSSPSDIQDKIVRLTESSKTRRLHFAFHLPTWEMNPNIKENDPSLLEESEDELEFLRNYAAIPPLAARPFFGSAMAIKAVGESVDKNRRPLFSYEPVIENGRVHVELKDIVTDHRIPRILALDAGEKDNSFALSLMHVEFPQTVNSNEMPKIVIDQLIEIIPDPDAGLSVSFAAIQERVIDVILNQFRVMYVIFDRWQSSHSKSLIESTDYQNSKKVKPVVVSLRYDDLSRVRASYTNGQVRIYQAEEEEMHNLIHEYAVGTGDVKGQAMRKIGNMLNVVSGRGCYDHVVTRFLIQLLRLRESKGAHKKVLKPMRDTDDLWRAVAQGVSFLMQEETMVQFARWDRTSAKKGGRYGGVSIHRMTDIMTNPHVYDSRSTSQLRGQVGGGASLVRRSKPWG